MQPESYEKKPNEEPPATIAKKDISAQLKRACHDLTQVRQYRCHTGSKFEPPAGSRIKSPLNGTSLQRTRSVIHALSRTYNTETRQPPYEQWVPLYSGSQSCHNSLSYESKPCYHTTNNELPSKSVLFDIMVKLVEAMRQKEIPFSFLVSDMPTYKLVTQPKAENHHPFKDIVPILGAFHQQISYIYAIYKRFKGSGMADTLVTAGVVAEEPVDQALKGRHYRHGLRCIMLWRETLIYIYACVCKRSFSIRNSQKMSN